MLHTFNPLPVILKAELCSSSGLAGLTTPPSEQEIKCLGLNSSNFEPASSGQGRVYICGKSTSSLDVAWQLEKEACLEAWDSVLCLSQSGGRGQLRRHWHSPEGNIYAALKLPPSLQGDMASLLVAFLAVKGMQNIMEKAFASSEEINNHSNLASPSSFIKFKWPNDVLWGEHKIGGILLEERSTTLVAGIGLNLVSAPPLSALREDSALPAGNVVELAGNFIKKPHFSPFSMWQSLVSMMRFWYESEVLFGNSKKYMQLIELELAWKGCLVRVCDYFAKEKEPVKFGRVLGLGSQGELRLLVDEREESIVSGSICLA